MCTVVRRRARTLYVRVRTRLAAEHDPGATLSISAPRNLRQQNLPDAAHRWTLVLRPQRGQPSPLSFPSCPQAPVSIMKLRWIKQTRYHRDELGRWFPRVLVSVYHRYARALGYLSDHIGIP